MSSKKSGRVAIAPGRYSPPQRGHVNFLAWLLREMVDHLIIPVGSCYDSGVTRYPLLAVVREKMLIWSLIDAGVDMNHVSILHLQDSPTKDDFAWWWEHLTSCPGFDAVTDFVTGNEEQILRQVDLFGLRSPKMNFINPERDVPNEFQFQYHASDLRKAIIENNYPLFDEIAASGTKALMGSIPNGFDTIREAAKDRGPQFVSGRQTVDTVVLCKSPRGRGQMLLCGRRARFGKDGTEKDFPGRLAIPGGAIDAYESPIDAAVRELQEETGLQVEIVARHLEPAHVLVNGHIARMRFVGLFGSHDAALSGTKGGSSQVFCIDLDLFPDELAPFLRSDSDLEEVAFRPLGNALKEGLAYQQAAMVKVAAAIRR